ncbi:MAG: class C beta-lactamase-related serine hydrolase [Caldilinea sp. CFX5]|nr:class C beta-lactamase-related serine hydrolase [Caldilinea sp. CFX5]
MKRLLNLMLIVVLIMPVIGCIPVREAAQRAPPVEWPTQAWPTSTPEEQGIDAAKLADGLQAIRRQGLNLHSVLIVRNGKLVLDATFYPYDGKAVHDVASVTKSIMTTLIAMAADQGKLNLDDPLLSFFPDRTIANRDARKEAITVRHLTSMSSGLDCTAANDEQTLREMEQSKDFVQFTLDRKMISVPGQHFVYCSPGMHLLSAILQQATGMTALEFAQQNLFEPLGIQAVIWPTDPQGYNHGWGDLHLQPRDMAKIGFLWLNHGEWAGKQLVPRQWVAASVKTQLKTGGNDDYGYGWWITGAEGEYAAIGRGGQRIQVWPAINAILVMTGGGVDIDDIEPLLSPAFADLSKPLPANPAGVTQLQAALAAVAQPPTPQPVAPLPALAPAISGKIFIMAPNPLGIDKMGVTFNDSAEATLQIAFGDSAIGSWPVGLDGVYRFFPGDYDLPQGLRGQWVDDATFVAEYDNIANNDHLFLRLHFAGDHLTVESQETAHELGVRFEGELQNP